MPHSLSKRRWGLHLAVLCLIVPTPAFAEGRNTAGDVQTLKTIVVTATKTPQNLAEVPNAITTKDGMDIEESPAQSVGELLANEPGVDFRTQGNYGGAGQALQIRGMDDDKVQIMLNGINLNSPSLGSADLGSLPYAGIEQIEITKGSGSILYGSGAMAGTVNVLTKDPQRDQTDLNATLGYGSFNTRRVAIEQGMFLGDQWGYYLTLEQQATDGQRENGDLEQRSGSLKLVYDRGASFTLRAFGFYLDKTFGKPGIQPPAGTQATQVNGETFYNAEAASLKDRGENIDQHGFIELESQLAPAITFRLRQTYSDMESIDTMRYNGDNLEYLPDFSSRIKDAAGEGERTWITNRVTGTEANLEWTPADGTIVLVGADTKRYEWISQKMELDIRGEEESRSRAQSDEAVNTHSVFTEVQWRPLTTLNLLGGLRQETHSEFGKETLPRFGAVITPTSTLAVKLNHGKHFKAPTLNDLYWPAIGNTYGNTNLKPETGWHSDISVIKGAPTNRWYAAVTYFQWNISDKIEWAEQPDNSWTPSNVNQSNGNGIEADIRFNPSYQWGFSLGYTYTNAQDELTAVTRRSQFVPLQRAKTAATWRHASGLTAQAVIQYLGERNYYASSTTDEPTEILAAYLTTDLCIQQRIKEHWLWALKVHNLMDESYSTYTGNFMDTNGTWQSGFYPGAQRTVNLSLSYQY